jgi:prepilin-type N-terminal cleavage/methylation domain-containing protein
MQRSSLQRPREAGFTLVEILAVLAVLGLLMGISVMAFSGHQDKAARATTRANMAELENLITVFENKFGDYPPDRLKSCNPAIKAKNDLNEGVEALLAALHSKAFTGGTSLTETVLANLDEDQTTTDYHRSGSKQLLEAVDGWGNPIAYFHYLSFRKSQEYLMDPEDGAQEYPQQTVEAAVSEVTGVFANADSYQLVSAGSDGLFGTDDDVTNF